MSFTLYARRPYCYEGVPLAEAIAWGQMR